MALSGQPMQVQQHMHSEQTYQLPMDDMRNGDQGQLDQIDN